MWLDYIASLIALLALVVAIVTAISVRRGTNSRARAAAIQIVMEGLSAKLEEEIASLKVAAVIRLEAEMVALREAAVLHTGTEVTAARLEEEVTKLQRGLDNCIKDRIGLKGEMQILRNALRVAREEIQSLRSVVKEVQEKKGDGGEEQKG